MLAHPYSISKSVAPFRHERCGVFLQFQVLSKSERERRYVMKFVALGFVVVLTGTTVWGRLVDSDFQRAHLNGARARIELTVHDEYGAPVSGASVHVLMGMNYRLNSYDIDGKTDTNGVFVIEGKTTGNEIEIKVTKDGWYRSQKKLCFIAMGHEHVVKNGKWQPWGMEIKIPMREVRNPVSLIKKKGGFSVPRTDAWIGFDMQLGDWVGYGGVGRTPDFEVKLQWDGKPVVSFEFARMELRFVGDGAGFYMANTTSNSAFSGIYNAATNEMYKKEFTCSTTRKNGTVLTEEIPSGKLMVVRSRCRLDDKGNVVEANYSFIRAVLIEGGYDGKASAFMNYRFNPTPNDTNLEPQR